MEFTEEVSKLGTLGDGIGDGMILGLSTRPQYRGQSLGGPQDEGATEEDAEARCGAPLVRTPNPIGVGIHHDHGRHRGMELDAETTGSFDRMHLSIVW
jgi:hypothetical protein